MDAFSSSDPLPPGPLPYALITNPQSLNKYAYTWNNPLSFVDPDGHCPVCVETAISVSVRVIPYVNPVYTGGILFSVIILAADVGSRRVGAAIVANAQDQAQREVVDTQVHAENQQALSQNSEEALESRVAAENRSKLDARGPPQPQTGAQPEPTEQGASHKKGARPSTQQKHEKGEARKQRDRGGERADPRRREHGFGWGKKPKKQKGPWPPKPQKSKNEESNEGQ